MIVYRLVTPIDEFDDLTTLPEWLRHATPEATAWSLQAVLALADAADYVGWRGDMRHLPSIAAPNSEADDLRMVIKQADNGATFVISANPLPWVEELASRRAEVPPRPIAAHTHPTYQDIAEAMSATTTDSPPTDAASESTPE